MRESTRRQVLADLGIVQWRLRAAQGEVPRQAAAPASPGAAVLRAETVEEPRPAPPETAEREPGPEPQSESEAEAPWSALSLAVDGVVLITDGEQSQRDLRLAMDILAAASGDWSLKPSGRRFDWPPGGVVQGSGGGADASRRALAAFLDKDLSDHQARLLVCTEPLAQFVPQPPASCRRVVIPALAELGRDADAKRALWGALTGTRR